MKVIMLIISLGLYSIHVEAASFGHLNNEQPQIDESKKIHEQAVELESVLISKMIEPMFPDGKESDLYGGGHGSDIFRQMMIDEYARNLAQSNGLGLAQNIERDLKR